MNNSSKSKNSKYSKTAKDIAFDRERSKLQATIRQRDEEIVRLRTQSEHDRAEIDSLRKQIELLETQIGIPKEQLLSSIERTKEVANYINLFSMRKVIK